MSDAPELSTSETARELRISTTWVLELVKRGDLSGRRIGNFFVITRASIEAYQRAKAEK